MRVSRNWLIVILACLLAVTAVSVGAETVVQLPFGENIPSFVPYYWQLQHILAQGTIFEGLFAYEMDPKGMGGVKVVPAIADKWTVSKDGKTWTITMRKDKKWSNGDPVTAKDFEWTYQYIGGPSLPDVPVWANQLQHMMNGWKYKFGGVKPEELGVKATDNYTLVFTLENPRFDFNCWLVVGGSMPLHRATVEKYGPNEWWKPGNFVGNGPYIPSEWTANTEATLVKNKNYVGTVGNVDKIILKNFTSTSSQIQAYQAGEIDLAWITTTSDLAFINTQADLKKAYIETPNDLEWRGYQITRGFSPAMDDVRVRKAFAMSIDRETLANTVFAGKAVAANSYWTDNDPIGKKMKGIPYDVKGAQKLLADAGYPGGKGLSQLKFYITGEMPEVEYLVNQWKQNLGVNVLIENLESGIYWNTYVWAADIPGADPGFTRINAGMNSFESGGLDKAGNQMLWSQGFPGNIRKQRYELEQEKTAVLAKEGGLKQSDWDSLVDYKDQLLPQDKKMVAAETNPTWKSDMMRKPTFDMQFQDEYDGWKKAATDKEKTEAWRNAWRILLGEEKALVEYNGMTKANKDARRLRYNLLNATFDKAMELAPAYCQLMMDQYYLVPVYMDKITYLQRPGLTGVNVYKFAWGPHPFNFKFLNKK